MLNNEVNRLRRVIEESLIRNRIKSAPDYGFSVCLLESAPTVLELGSFCAVRQAEDKAFLPSDIEFAGIKMVDRRQ